MNIRGEIWKYVCRVDEIKQREINNLRAKRDKEIREKGHTNIPIIRDDKSLYQFYLSMEKPENCNANFSKDIGY